MSGNRRNHNPRQDAPRSGRNDSLRSESDPSQQDMHQLTTGLQSSSIGEPNLPAHAPPPSRPPYQPQGYQNYRAQGPRPMPPPPPAPYSSNQPLYHPAYGPPAPREWGPPPPSPYAESQPASPPLLGNPQQLASRRRVQGGVAADQLEATQSAYGGTQPNTGRAQAHAPVSSDMVSGSTPLDPPWTAEQIDRMTAHKNKYNRARWNKVADDVGGGHKPFDCENKWLKMERVRMRKESEEKEGKGKESKRDRSPDTEDKEERGGQPRQRQRK